MIRESFNYIDYLALKKSVDDRSLNTRVWETMANWIRTAGQPDRQLRVLEIGAGIGTMIERLLDAGLLTHCRYTAVELEAGFGPAALRRHSDWAKRHGCNIDQSGENQWSLHAGDDRIDISWLQGDALQVHKLFPAGSFDLVIGHAVIDLLPVPACIPDLFSCLDRGGAYYFSLNYAGETLFLPPVTGDDDIFSAYNADMDKRFPNLAWEASQTGLRLGPWLVSHGHRLLAEGESDWKLRARNGELTNLFIENILATIETALAGMPGLTDWLLVRRQQLNDAGLMFRATNRDCFGLKG